MNSITLPQFWSLYRALPPDVRKAARAAFHLFQVNPAHPGLQFHRLHRYPDYWSVRVSRDCRAVGRRKGNTITWGWIGSHAEFDQLFPP